MVKKKVFEKNKLNWGLSTLITIYNCDPVLIKNQEAVKQFVYEICEVINMERHRNPLIDRFGDDELEGVSCIQLIKTSSITVHCDEIKNRVFVDIFSCKWFDQKKATMFCTKYFKSEKYVVKTVVRA